MALFLECNVPYKLFCSIVCQRDVLLHAVYAIGFFYVTDFFADLLFYFAFIV